MRKTLTLRALLTAYIRSGYPGCLDIHETVGGGIYDTFYGLPILHPRQDEAEEPGPGAGVHLARLQKHVVDYGHGWRISTRHDPHFEDPDYVPSRFLAVISEGTVALWKTEPGVRPAPIVQAVGPSPYEAFLLAYFHTYIGNPADHTEATQEPEPAAVTWDDLEDALTAIRRFADQVRDAARK